MKFPLSVASNPAFAAITAGHVWVPRTVPWEASTNTASTSRGTGLWTRRTGVNIAITKLLFPENQSSDRLQAGLIVTPEAVRSARHKALASVTFRNLAALVTRNDSKKQVAGNNVHKRVGEKPARAAEWIRGVKVYKTSVYEVKAIIASVATAHLDHLVVEPGINLKIEIPAFDKSVLGVAEHVIGFIVGDPQFLCEFASGSLFLSFDGSCKII